AARAGEHDRPGEPVGPHLRAVAAGRLARDGTPAASELAGVPPGPAATARRGLRSRAHAPGRLGGRGSAGHDRGTPGADGASDLAEAGAPPRDHELEREP